MSVFTPNQNATRKNSGIIDTTGIVPAPPNKKFSLLFSSLANSILKPKFYNFEQIKSNDILKYSLLGTPIYTSLELKSNDNSKSVVLDAVVVDISQSRNIVKTSLQGRDGTVKEYISDGDYSLNIKGILVNEESSDLFPERELKSLLEIVKIKDSIKVISQYVQLFGITQLVVESYSVPQEPGQYNMVVFELTCSSDTPIELKINA